MNFDVPGQGDIAIETVIFDLNGTLTIDGQIIEGVHERMNALREHCSRLFLFTGDTLGTGKKVADELGLEIRLTPNAQAKADEARKLGAETTAAIGNGRIDLELFQTVRLRLATLQAEGLHSSLLHVPDVVLFTSINDAIDHLLKKTRLIATSRK